jgi:4-amino-4-deoxy-L-arabinose transferase-like glycosyltransferase
MAAFPRANQRWILPAAVFVVAAVTLLGQLGSYGLWDPQEITVADQARDAANKGQWGAVAKKQPPLTVWLVAASTQILGPSELAARLPLALLGLIGALAVWRLGARLGRPRAGLFAAVILVSSPLYLFQSRQLTSDVGTVVASTIAMYGLAGLIWWERRWIDGAIAVVGLVLAHLSDGLFLGAWVPLAGAAVAAVATLWQDDRRPRAALALGGAAILALGWLFVAVFDVVTAQPGQIGLFGKTLAPAREYLPILGGQWRQGQPPPSATFDYIVNQVAFGMFPWSAIAPIAVLRLATGRGGKAVLFLAWAVVGYAAATLWVRKVGDLRFPALAPIALAVGWLLDEVLDDEKSEGLPLAALFVLLAGFILALDIKNFPDEISSVHLAGRGVKSPLEASAYYWGILMLGGVTALAAATGLYAGSPDPRRARIGRTALWAAIGAGGAFGLYLAQVYTPAMSQHFSYKNLFQSYFDHRTGSEPLAVMGIPGSGPEFYSRGKLSRVEAVPQLLQFLNSSEKPPVVGVETPAGERAFAIVPVDRRCQIQEVATTQRLTYHVLDNRNARFLLLTNKLLPGEKDQNPLLDAFPGKAPETFARTVTANFDDTIELLGTDMPDHVSKGSRFKMTFWFRVKKRPTQNYKVLVHFDGGAIRFQGDHDPVGGLCGASQWQPGSIVKDTFEVTAGDMTNPKGTYQVFTGLFTGGSGFWKNLKVLSDPHGPDDRVPIGTLVVD